MTIKEVSEKYGISQDTLRFYEKKGLIGPIKRTRGGIRNYDEHDLSRVEFVKCMRSAELPIEVLKRYVELFDAGADTVAERKRLLEEQRDILKKKIEKMQEAYERLTYKIDLYYNGKLDEYLEITNRMKDCK